MQKLIVTSATYRQSSKATPELLQKDPENRLLARGPRLRLPAEMIRDQALAVSGLLVEQARRAVREAVSAGRAVEGAVGTGLRPGQGRPSSIAAACTRSGSARARRPRMMTFDAAGREACVVRDTRTNTPLQALDLMNDVTYLEAARKLAERMMREARRAPTSGSRSAFRLVTARRPTPREAEPVARGARELSGRLQGESRGGGQISEPGRVAA